MKYYQNYANLLYPIDKEYTYFYVDMKTFKEYDHIDHVFTMHDYLPMFIKPCGEEDVNNLLTNNYVVLIQVKENIIPITGIVER